MGKIQYIINVICPVITAIMSLVLGFVTMYIENHISLMFGFLSIQFYLNWYLVYNINRKVTIPFTMTTCQDSQGGTRFWYCGKCKHYTRRPAQHCMLCKKCYYYRDHHCFFLGGCVLRQNIGNFILVCIYASFTCIYSVFTLGSYLYDYFEEKSILNRVSMQSFALHFFFPITVAKYFMDDDESVNIFFVTLFNVSISIACFSLFYGLWKLYICLSGRQRYYPDEGKKQDIYEIFGSYGLMNFMFPYNGFLHNRSIDEKYEIKSV